MLIRTWPVTLLVPFMLSGCVSKGVHTETLAELDKTRAAAEAAKKQSAAELEAVKKQSAADLERLQTENGRLAEEVAKLQKQAEQEAGRAATLGSQLAERDQ